MYRCKCRQIDVLRATSPGVHGLKQRTVHRKTDIQLRYLILWLVAASSLPLTHHASRWSTRPRPAASLGRHSIFSFFFLLFLSFSPGVFLSCGPSPPCPLWLSTFEASSPSSHFTPLPLCSHSSHVSALDRRGPNASLARANDPRARSLLPSYSLGLYPFSLTGRSLCMGGMPWGRRRTQ
ncbi:hypothetical protein SODALDRAFT_117381 [Sodiomyces alkalinus F11]|uniref:Transmembrane protein n=1 Tax=Sodiomyces alkalinus (strain CBS 110278 / VKM F-3762 / F11) TaxID=1314773 RepID=A0A3N2Q3V0_SODAK|nr:hypothetical protein SODALDRAFT_117381 [Sodiomyces alkalinus F11]ROT41348.1 hypothetical protein SODALDRAFT_117381 [Sodiomyces alkalinus F11]